LGGLARWLSLFNDLCLSEVAQNLRVELRVGCGIRGTTYGAGGLRLMCWSSPVSHGRVSLQEGSIAFFKKIGMALHWVMISLAPRGARVGWGAILPSLVP
jgi:hypothetical protein